MASAEAELILRLTDQTQKGFESVLNHLKQVQKEARDTESATSKLGGAFKDFGSGLLGGFGIGAGFFAAEKAGQAFASALLAIPNALAAIGSTLLDSTKKVIDLGGKFTDLSAKTGIAASALQKLEFAGSQVGVGLDQITGAVSKMQASLVDAPEKFNRLGLSAQALRQMKPEEQFATIAEKIAGIKDPAERAAAAVEIFGKAGTALLPLMTANMRELMAEAERLGLVLGDDIIAAADDLGDSIDTLGLVWEGLKNNVAAVVVTSEPLHRLFQGIIELLGNLSKTTADNRDQLRALVDGAVVLVADGLVLLAKAAEIASAAWTVLMQGWALAENQATNLATAIRLGAEVISGNLSITAAAAIAANTATEANKKLAQSIAEEEQKGRERHATLMKVTSAFEDLREKVAAGVGIIHKSTGEVEKQTTALGLSAKAIAERQKAEEQWSRFESDVFKRSTAALNAYNDEQKRLNDARVKAQIEALVAQKKALDDWHAALVDMQRASDEAFAQMLDDLRGVADSMAELGDAVGGTLGDFLSFGAGALNVLTNLNDEALRSASGLQKVAGVLQGATAAFKSGSLFGGAAAGAAAGAAFGPIGAGIGALAGGLLGLFGKAEKARKELAKLRGEVLDQFGGMENLRRAAESVGINIEKAFTTKSPEEAKRIFDSLNKALEEKQHRLEGIKTAIGGLELLTRGFAAQMERTGAATDQSQAAFGRLGNFAVATFAGLVRETGDLIGALNQMGPSLDTLNQMMADFGLQASGALARLLQLRTVVVENEDVANSISGLAQLMKGLGEAGLITRDLLLDMGAQARANFDELIARGVDAEAAMSLMQPTLQELWEQHKRLGVTYDENTQALIDQAEQQGLVGEAFLSTNEQMLEVLKILVETLGGELPAALRRMGDAAEDEFNRMGDAATRAGDAASRIPGGPVEGSFATGIREVPRTMVARLHAGEEVVPASDRGARRSASARGSGQVIVLQSAPVFLDGRKVGLAMERRIETGDIAPRQVLRRAR